ncbi:unnamed protein product [Blepharisma stoltei]|uniref:Uncharacterized protein n=1 Tax=Blepharisma stoltei TaxID=1481888 RepID=A0AAU9K7Q4_9CILI|nr:unnamed protein product [Blepharisma stoltei]
MADSGIQAYTESIAKTHLKYRDALQDMQEELLKEKKWRQEAETENRNLRKNLLTLEEQITDYRYSSVELHSRLDEYAEANKELHEENQEKREKFDALKEKFEKERNRSETLERELEKFQKFMNELRDEVSDKQKALEDWKEALELMEDKLKSVSTQKNKYKEEMDLYKEALENSKNENSLLKIQIEVKGKEKEEMKKEISHQCDELNIKIKEMMKKHQEELEFWKVNLSSQYETVISNERQNVDTYKKKLGQSNEINEKIKNERDRLLRNIEDLRRDISEQAEQISTIKFQKESLENLLNTQVRELEENLFTTDDNYKQLLVQKDKSIQQLESQLQTAQEKLKEFAFQSTNSKESEIFAIKEMERLQDLLRDKDTEISSLKNVLNEHREEITQIRENIEEQKCSHLRDIKKACDEVEERYKKKLLENEKKIKEILIKNEEEKTRRENENENNQINILKVKEEYMQMLIEKEESIVLLNTDRDRLQKVVQDLEKQLKEIIYKMQADAQDRERLLRVLKDENIKKDELEQKNLYLRNKIAELEQRVEDELEACKTSMSEKDSQIKRIKEKYHSMHESKLEEAEVKLSTWKERFREEIGYMEKWGETMETDLNSQAHLARLRSILNRLYQVLDYSQI